MTTYHAESTCCSGGSTPKKVKEKKPKKLKSKKGEDEAKEGKPGKEGKSKASPYQVSQRTKKSIKQSNKIYILTPMCCANLFYTLV